MFCNYYIGHYYSRKSMTINYLTEQLVFNNNTPQEESLIDIN